MHEKLKSFEDFLVVLSCEIGDSGANINLELWSILEAGLKVGFVVVTSETMDETRKEVSDFDGGEDKTIITLSVLDSMVHLVRKAPVVSSLNWANGKSGKVSKVSSGLEIVLSIPISFEGLDISCNLSLVEGVVGSEVLGEFSWVLED